MPSHHRRRHHKDPDDEQLPLRVEESHVDPYSRLSNDSRHTSNYRRTDSTSSNSGRNSYDMNRASSSRPHRDSNWRPKDTENRYTDDYYRERREEYDVAKSREPESWPAHTVPEPRYSERDWQRYDAGYPTSSYSESSSWAIPSNTAVDHRNGHQERWQSHDYRAHSRGSAFKERPSERAQVVDQRRDWAHDQRRGKDDEKWASGSGWESGRVENRGNAWVEPPPRWNPLPDKKPLVDNRSWEPAPTWQPSGSGERQNHRNQHGPRGDYYNKTPAGGRRAAGTSNNNATYRNHNHTNNKPQRDWRHDDGNPNNWNRRDSQGPERAESSPAARKHLRSPTRSRSDSPAESYYSRRSSRGRTRSPSASPASKRRRRDSSPVASRPSHEGSPSAWIPRQSPASMQLPESGTYKLGNPRRNASPASSMSAGRSLSRSHSPNPELQHSVSGLSSTLAIISSPRSVVDKASRRNGTSAANGNHNKRTPQTQILAHAASVDIMPPPTIIPPANSYRPAYDPLPSLPKMPMGPTRITPKTSGFKPIGQSSSSLKKFFPGDEEDMDISSDMSVAADPDVQEPASQPTIDRPPEPPFQVEQPKVPIPSQSAEDDQPLPRLPSSPLAPSRGSSVVMEEDPPEPPMPRPSPPPPQQSHLETTDAGVSTPSVQTRSELYAIVSQVGEGTFGKVYKAQNTVTKLHVALKRIRMESEKEGFPVTAMREIKLLQSLRHENVVQLYEMMVSNGSVYMVFEYMDHDLTGILSQTQFIFTDAHLKSLSHQMLAGLAYLHHKGVIHRDIKGSNILINNRGELKLADFGLARFYQKRRRTDYTNRVITLWYRPPELLLGATIYGPEVDMWSAGCIMLELFTKKPVFQGDDEIHQLDTIYRVIGTPTPDRWSDVTNLPWYELVKPKGEIPNHFREMFRKWMSPAALDLAERLLCYDPAARATAVQAMEAPYFKQEEPPASAPVGLATLHGEWHELETKRERAKKRRRNETAVQ